MTRRRPTRRVTRREGRFGSSRVARASLAMCAVTVVASGLAGCANQDGTDLARQACRHVDRSLTLYRASLHASDATAARSKQSEAMAELRDALPLASIAAGQAGQYQALMATLTESDHLPESLLVHALGAQCTAVNSSGGLAPSPPPTADTPATHPPPTGL